MTAPRNGLYWSFRSKLGHPTGDTDKLNGLSQRMQDYIHYSLLVWNHLLQ